MGLPMPFEASPVKPACGVVLTPGVIVPALSSAEFVTAEQHGRVSAFLNSIRQTLPSLLGAFESIRSSSSTASEEKELRELYSSIPATSFSQDVMSVRPTNLAVLCATGLGWSDLGEPSRVLLVLESKVPRQNGDSLRALNLAGRLASKVLGYGLERTEA